MNWEDEPKSSRLALDRFASGELKGTDRAKVQQDLAKNPQAMEHLEALKRAKGAIRPLDIAALRERAGVPAPLPKAPPPAPPAAFEEEDLPTEEKTEEMHDLQTAEEDVEPALVEASVEARAPDLKVWKSETAVPAPLPKPANRRWLVWGMLGLAAALATLVVYTGESPNTIRLKGAPSLQVFSLESGVLKPYQGTALGAGDVIGLQVGGEAKTVAVFSVDGNGKISQFHPDEGQTALVLDGRTEPLPGSITLDNAPGPELMIAVFDTPVSEARSTIDSQWKKGGYEALLRWDQGSESVDTVPVKRK